MWIKGCSAYEAMAHLAEGKVITLAPSFFHHATTTTATNLTMKGKEAAPCLVLNSVNNLPRAILDNRLVFILLLQTYFFFFL